MNPEKKPIPEDFFAPYNPQAIEPELIKIWETSGLANPDVCIEQGYITPDAEPFSMVLPPPNVTGTLHTGHAFMLVIQDIMTRYARMQGKRTLWLPGTDHAAIATQSKVEKELEKKGMKKRDMSRDEFLGHVQQFAQDSHDTIVSQIKRMGATVDWSREAFTLDDKRNHTVNTVFKKMYEDGLIYRGYRVVNWDPKGQTVISDDEIVHEERDSMLYTFKYWHDFPIAISTTRPETKVGDVAVAVHPDDARYAQYIGNTYEGIFCNVPLTIKIIADESVEKDFGTGALGVTPAHSIIDWEISQRHNLEIKPVIDEYAKMTVGNEIIRGKKTTEARQVIVDWLQSENLLEKSEPVKQNVATAERTGGIIEPMPKLQWFINVNKPIADRGNRSLKELMLDAVHKDGIEILPDRFEKTYFHWIENLRDWNISRQIWYGHRIPAYFDLEKEENKFGLLRYKGGKLLETDVQNEINKIYQEVLQLGHIDEEIESHFSMRFEDNLAITFNIAKKLLYKKIVTLEDLQNFEGIIDYTNKATPEVFTEKPKTGFYLRDSDTLDTWFSSGMWTFSTLGWPEKTADFETYHPTTVLETGPDILFFWVARMILMSQYILGEIPFKTVYLHGLVRDEKGRKMSKSLGNIVNPLDVIAKHGTDALRMGMIVGVGPGSDNNLSEDKIKAYSKFANKIWNATRFVLENTIDLDTTSEIQLDTEDQQSYDELKKFIAEITKEMNEFKYYLVAEKLYHYFWNNFASIIIERSKTKIQANNSISAQWILHIHLTTLLKALHPFMPFITEHIWSKMKNKTNSKKLLIIESWPTLP